MKKTLVIKSVNYIEEVEKPFVVLRFDNYPEVLVRPMQLLLALHNGGQAGYAQNANSPFLRKAFVSARGCEIEGDFIISKPGDKYIPTEKHPVFTDPNHPKYGTIKLGEALVVEKGASFIEGIPTVYPSMAIQQMEINAEIEMRFKYSGKNPFAVAPVKQTTAGVETPEHAAFDEME